MAKIQILDDTLASQVAAGEVVERPASVVKELVENSLDASASHVTVEIQRGGTALVKVTDDGCGMSREDALLSLERHATSKLHTSEQLSAIMTLGFRVRRCRVLPVFPSSVCYRVKREAWLVRR